MGVRLSGELDANWQGSAMCVCSTGRSRSGKQGRGGPLSVGHMMSQGNLMSVCRAGLPQGGVGCGRGVPWREDGSKRDRGTEGSQRGKRTMAVRIGRTERRKERSCGRSRCVQDNAGRLQRLTGDNVRPLMRPAQRREEAQGGSTQRGAWERIREGRPQSGRSDAHKKSPCSFLQGRNMVGHQGLEPRTN